VCAWHWLRRWLNALKPPNEFATSSPDSSDQRTLAAAALLQAFKQLFDLPQIRLAQIQFPQHFSQHVITDLVLTAQAVELKPLRP